MKIIAEKITENNIRLKIQLDGGEARTVGFINKSERTLGIKRERSKHLHRKSNSYGFSIDVLQLSKTFDYIKLKDEFGEYTIPKEVILSEGKNMSFGSKGFEPQIFLGLNRIEEFKVKEDEVKLIDAKDKAKKVIGEAWAEKLWPEFEKPYMKKLSGLIQAKRATGAVFPKPADVFNAYKATPLSEVRVVILGQDPYPTPGHAHGLAFSTLGEKIPVSLRNIFKEIEDDVYNGLALNLGNSGDLTYWTKQGIFLLNTILTVDAGEPLSHQGLGWEEFTTHTIRTLNQYDNSIVFILWGAHARKLKSLIDNPRHLILEAAHPAVEAYGSKGYFGCKHFSQANEFLRNNYNEEIKW